MVKRFFMDYVAPHELFGCWGRISESAVGACLPIEFLTRASAAVGLFMLINYYLGLGMARGGPTLAQPQTFIIVLAIIVLSSPGRTLGLDGLLFASRKGSRA
jgi:uncharacterized membrane protein YphA (DoxX/SURF4 family)